MSLPHPLRFLRGWNLYGLDRAGFSIHSRYRRGAQNKLKTSRVESIVSRPLKFAEGGAASVGLMEGCASLETRPSDNSGVPVCATLVTNSPSRTVRRRTYRTGPML